MLWDFADYSGSDDEPLLPLLLSERSQELILAAMKEMDKRYNWLADDDGTWDAIHAALGEAYDEIMSDIMPDFTPVGTVVWYIGETSSIPAKWLKCTGQTVSDTDYPELAAVLGTPFHVHPNITLPDLRERFLYGAALNADLGDTGGAATHTLTTAEIPAHTHGYELHTANGATATAARINAATTVTKQTQSEGGGGAHNNMPPYVRGYWIIKVLP